MLNCLNLDLKYLLQIPKKILGTKLLRIKTSFFISSSGRVEIGFHNTAGFFLLKVWKKFEFGTLERKSFRSNLSFGHVRAVWRTHKRIYSRTFECVSVTVWTNVLNCKESKKTFFHRIWPPDILNAVLKVLIFFRWMSKIFFLKILK